MCSSPRPACVHNSLPLRPNGASVSIQTAPFHRVTCPPRRSCTIWRTRSIVRSHGTHEGSSQTWRQAFLRNTRRRIFHASGARHSPLNRLSNQCATLVNGLRRETSQHFGNQTVGRAIGFVPEHLSSCPHNLIHNDHHPTPPDGIHIYPHSFAVFESSRPVPRRFRLYRRSSVRSGP